MTPAPQRETEFKLLADGTRCSPAEIARVAATLGIELRERTAVEQVDVYLDDGRYHLTRAGVGLRVRSSGRDRVLCVKTERPRNNGAFRRDEVEVPIPGAPPARTRDLPAELRDRVEPFVLGAKLRPIAGLRTSRQRLDGESFEVTLDHVEVADASGEPVGEFAEVEIELRNGGRLRDAETLADALRHELGLVDSEHNKLQRALGLQRVDVGADAALAVDADLPIREAVRRVFAQHVSRLQREEVRVRTKASADGVHKLRVACRRLRAALRTFAPWLERDERRTFRDALRATATAFGAVRDLDVLADDLEHRADRLPPSLRKGARRVVARLRARGRKRRRRARAVLRSPERLAALAQLRDFVERDARRRKDPTVRDVAPDLIRAAADAVFAHGATLDASSPADAVHELRILLKRLRYTAECFVDAYGKDLARFCERATLLQEVLGEFNDAAVAVRALDDLARRSRDLDRKALQALGACIQLQHQRGLEARRRFHTVWAEFDSDDLRTWLDAVLRSPRRA